VKEEQCLSGEESRGFAPYKVMVALKNVHTSSAESQPHRAAVESSGAGHFFPGQMRDGANMYPGHGCGDEERSLQLPAQRGRPARPGHRALHGRHSVLPAVLPVPAQNWARGAGAEAGHTLRGVMG